MPDTSPFLVERLMRRKFYFFWFLLLTSVVFIGVYVLAISTCVICFHMFASLQSCSFSSAHANFFLTFLCLFV